MRAVEKHYLLTTTKWINVRAKLVCKILGRNISFETDTGGVGIRRRRIRLLHQDGAEPFHEHFGYHLHLRVRMALSKEVIRNLLLYEKQLGHSAQTAFENINRAKGRQVVSRATAFRWFSKFDEDDINLKDRSRSGRPQEIDRDAIIEAIDLDPTLTTEDLADEFDCSKMQISRILRAAGKRWKKAKWVPHELNASQMNKRKEVARALGGNCPIWWCLLRVIMLALVNC
jgi:transposase